MAETMTPLQLAVAMAVATTVVAAAAALPPFCRAAAYARPAAWALPDAKADASAYMWYANTSATAAAATAL